MRFFLLGLIALAACTNGGNCDSCNNTNVGTDTDSGDTTCDSCNGDDTGTPPAETSYVQIEVFVPTEDDIVACHAELTGPEAYAFDTTDENGDPVIVPVLVGDYSLKDGDMANLTSYGTAIHTASDGSLSIAPADASANVVAATETDPQIVTVDNIPYFAGVYSCGYDEYTFDPDTADHKSGTPRHLGDWTTSVEVQADGKVEAIDNASDFSVLTLHSYFIVTADNTLDAVFYEDDGETVSVEGSEITPTTFAATVIDTDFGVVMDLLCTQ